MGEEQEEKSVECPHCGERLAFDFVTKFKNRSLVHFKLAPQPGNLIAADTLGGSIENMGNLLDACGEDAGVKTKTFIHNVSMNEDGEITTSLLICRVPEDKEPTDAP